MKKLKLVLTEFEAKTWLKVEYLLSINGPEQSAINRIKKKIETELHREGLD